MTTSDDWHYTAILYKLLGVKGCSNCVDELGLVAGSMPFNTGFSAVFSSD